MDEKTAWLKFCSTGSVLDYLNYKNVKEREAEAENSASNASIAREDVYKNGRPDYKGANYRRERQTCNSPDKK